MQRSFARLSLLLVCLMAWGQSAQASLCRHVDRLVMSCVMEIDHQGEILGYELNAGVIRSAERMTYTDVNLILEGDPGVRKRYERLVGECELMRDLATILNRKRERRGSRHQEPQTGSGRGQCHEEHAEHGEAAH